MKKIIIVYLMISFVLTFTIYVYSFSDIKVTKRNDVALDIDLSSIME